MLCIKASDVINNYGKTIGFSLINGIFHASPLMVYMFGLKVDLNFKFKWWEGVTEYIKWILGGPTNNWPNEYDYFLIGCGLGFYSTNHC